MTDKSSQSDPKRASTSAEPRNRIDIHVGGRVRTIRQHRGVSTVELAGHLGVDEATLLVYETGEKRIGAVHLLAISEFLDVPIRVFFED
jgi:transcriptional regulator with XRE-family HTH domain